MNTYSPSFNATAWVPYIYVYIYIVTPLHAKAAACSQGYESEREREQKIKAKQTNTRESTTALINVPKVDFVSTFWVVPQRRLSLTV